MSDLSRSAETFCGPGRLGAGQGRHRLRSRGGGPVKPFVGLGQGLLGRAVVDPQGLELINCLGSLALPPLGQRRGLGQGTRRLTQLGANLGEFTQGCVTGLA